MMVGKLAAERTYTINNTPGWAIIEVKFRPPYSTSVIRGVPGTWTPLMVEPRRPLWTQPRALK